MVLEERYTIDTLLGQGGFGAVYRGTHRQMQTPVAIKVLHAHHAASGEVATRFELEARRSASLRHPNTVRVFDFGRDADGSLFLVMELLEGAPLSSHLARGPFAPERAVHVLSQVLAALDEAHRQALVHRDLKPDNVFLTRLGKDEDFVKVLDFGIAKALDANTKLTASGTVIGTPTYMSPEQCRGAAIDPRSDLYSLGCIAFELLSGRPPFKADSALGLIFAHVQEQPDLAALPAATPRYLVDWIGRSLAKEPDQRFPSAEAAREALLAVAPPSSTPRLSSATGASLAEPAVQPTPLATDRADALRPPARGSRGPLLWGALGGGALVLGGLALAGVFSSSSEGPGHPTEAATPAAIAPSPTLPQPADLAAATPPVGANDTQPVAVADTHTTPSADTSPQPTATASPTLAAPTDAAPTEPARDVSSTPTPVAGTADAGPAAPERPVEVTKVERVSLGSVPPGATVKRGGAVVGKTPLELEWARGEPAVFKVELRGHDTISLRAKDLEGKASHEVRLQKTVAKDAGEVAMGGGGASAEDLYKQARELHHSDPGGALKLYQQAAAKGHPAAWKMIGAIQVSQGNTPAAIQAYKRYLIAAPGARDAEVVRDVITRLGGTP